MAITQGKMMDSPVIMEDKMIQYRNSYDRDIFGGIHENRKPTYSEVWLDADSFIQDYKSIGIPTTITDESATTLFYLLYANYGGRIIAPDDETVFKYKVFSLVFQYGPTWEKKLEIQEKFRGLTEDELIAGSVQIYNHATNPSTEPSTDSTDILTYIDGQNVTKNQKSKMDAYLYLWEALETDVTKQFIDRFNKCFLRIGERFVWSNYAEETEE